MDPIHLDELDLRILRVLQQDAALTNQALAARVHASPPTCLRRVRRMKELGVIQRSIAVLDRSKLGPTLTAIIEVTLDMQTADDLAHFEARANVEASVLQCYRVSPGPDFVLIVEIEDMPAYHEFARRVFASDAKVRNVRTFFATHCAKFEVQAPLAG
jgi:Lrp/AsnC family transcriptional regulator, leucine-responsive regulatory protein